MNGGSGTYVLVMRSDTEARIAIGRRGSLDLRPGHYLYVGSAFGPGGLRARVSRHCRRHKVRHWHIDYLREHVTVQSVWYSESQQRLEHRWADALGKRKGMVPVPGFGCTDCRCDAHLFFAARRPALGAFTKAVSGSVREWCCVEGSDDISVFS